MIITDLENPQKLTNNNIKITNELEIEFANFLDKNNKIVSWNYETYILTYYFENKKKKYNVDFWIKLDDESEYLFEIKSQYQMKKPIYKPNKSKTYEKRLKNYNKNIAKWKSAKSFISKLRKQEINIKFKVITEKDFNKTKKTFNF